VVSEISEFCANIVCHEVYILWIPVTFIHNYLVGKSEGKKPLGRPKRRWEDIRMDLRELRRESMNWMHLTQERDHWRTPVNMLMNLRVPWWGGG